METGIYVEQGLNTSYINPEHKSILILEIYSFFAAYESPDQNFFKQLCNTVVQTVHMMIGREFCGATYFRGNIFLHEDLRSTNVSPIREFNSHFVPASLYRACGSRSPR